MIFGLFALTHDFGTVHLTSIPRVVEKELRLDGGTADDAEKDPGAKDERHNLGAGPSAELCIQLPLGRRTQMYRLVVSNRPSCRKSRLTAGKDQYTSHSTTASMWCKSRSTV